MPELPDIQIYLDALERTVLGRTLENIRIGNPFLLRSVEPSMDRFKGRKIMGIDRMGKRIVFEFMDD